MPPYKQYEPVSCSIVEQMFTDFLYGKEVDTTAELHATHLKPWEIEEIISSPSSDFNKILDGYPYTIYLNSTILTGAGGARHLYKAMMQEGMTEEQICSVIYVILGEKEYPLNGLKIIEKHDGSND